MRGAEEFRMFIAIPIPGEVTSRIREVELELGRSLSGVKWVEPENLHITLKFLGNVPSNRVEEIAEGLRRAARGLPSFKIGLTGIGCFPPGGNPRVIWVGIREGGGELRRFSSRVEEEMEGIGFPREKRQFVPHLTLGRARDGFQDPRGVLGTYQTVEFGSFMTRSIRLMRSRLTRSGPIYSLLAEADLEG